MSTAVPVPVGVGRRAVQEDEAGQVPGRLGALQRRGVQRTAEVIGRQDVQPMVPLDLFRSKTVSVTLASGFAFMVACCGAPFDFSLYFQQHRGLPALTTGVAFLPMMLIGAAPTPVSARIAERVGRRALIVTGLAVMTVGLSALAIACPSGSPWLLSALLMLVGLGGPLVAPSATAVLLDAVQVAPA